MGTLYLVATPIGNLEDITHRALRILGEVGLIAAEDTRHTRKLLGHYGVNSPLISYHEHNKIARLDEILQALQEKDVAVVSDAGTPGLSDPGYELVRAAWDAGHVVRPIPGPSAPIAALVASGLPSDSFLYLGYLPKRAQERRALLAELGRLPWTLIAFEAPHRLKGTLADIESNLGADRQIAVSRELTKLHEEILRGSVAEIRHHLERAEPKGEITLVVEGAPVGTRWEEETVRRAVAERLEDGDSPSEVARQVAKLAGWPRREVYRMTLEAK